MIYAMPYTCSSVDSGLQALVTHEAIFYIIRRTTKVLQQPPSYGKSQLLAVQFSPLQTVPPNAGCSQ